MTDTKEPEVALAELIERLEKATGHQRCFDAAIWEVVKGTPAALGGQDPLRFPPEYTASIDAALTLVPPWSWRVGNLPSGRAFADLGTQASLQCVEGVTPAIALCIAALKARERS